MTFRLLNDGNAGSMSSADPYSLDPLEGAGVIERTGLEATIRRAADPFVLMQRVADEAVELVEGADGVLVGFANDETWLTFACAAGSVSSHVGGRIRLGASLAGLAFQRGETVHADDTTRDPRVDPTFRRLTAVKSLVCVPLWRHHTTVGVLCVTSARAKAFKDRDVATLTSLAEFISVSISVAFDMAESINALLSRVSHDAPGAAVAYRDNPEAEERFVANVLSPGALRSLETRSRFDPFLSGRGLTHVFQPIYDMTSGTCFAVEALARFSGRPKRGPDTWFAEAHALGVGVELEIASLTKALRAQVRLPRDMTMCVNAGPEAIVSDDVDRLLATCDARRVVMELTEETKVDDYPRLSSALERLCLMGVRLAIDDTGAGFASFAHILKLSPNLIKLDRELTSGIDHDPVRVSLATALVSFASQLGAEIVAEGIETAAELQVLRGLGIRYGQGYFLCRPTSISSIPTRLPREVWMATAEMAS
jgi:EAL domain-containing protein (putative c-di-GMP-specific phosphodiesterase class I)